MGASGLKDASFEDVVARIDISEDITGWGGSGMIS